MGFENKSSFVPPPHDREEAVPFSVLPSFHNPELQHYRIDVQWFNRHSIWTVFYCCRLDGSNSQTHYAQLVVVQIVWIKYDVLYTTVFNGSRYTSKYSVDNDLLIRVISDVCSYTFRNRMVITYNKIVLYANPIMTFCVINFSFPVTSQR